MEGGIADKSWLERHPWGTVVILGLTTVYVCYRALENLAGIERWIWVLVSSAIFTALGVVVGAKEISSWEEAFGSAVGMDRVFLPEWNIWAFLGLWLGTAILFAQLFLPFTNDPIRSLGGAMFITLFSPLLACGFFSLWLFLKKITH